MTTSRTKNVES